MDFTTFTEKVTKGVQQFLGEQVDVSVRDVRKNNGVYLKGMTMFGEGSNMSPTVYLNDFYEDYNRGKTLSSVVGDIVKIYDQTKVHGNMNMDFFLNYERVRNQIFCKLINYEKNREILGEIPHNRYLDLAVVCYFSYTNEMIGNGTIMIQESHMKSWGIEKEQLFSCALSNTQNKLGYLCLNMNEMMRDMLLEGFYTQTGALAAFADEIPEEITMDYVKKMVDDMLKERRKKPMYVVTNKNKCLGAICMMFDHVLSEMADEMGGDFYILPSSVHEVILAPEGEVVGSERLREIVKEVNASQVEPQEVLSDSVYYYDRKRHEVLLL